MSDNLKLKGHIYETPVNKGKERGKKLIGKEEFNFRYDLFRIQ